MAQDRVRAGDGLARGREHVPGRWRGGEQGQHDASDVERADVEGKGDVGLGVWAEEGLSGGTAEDGGVVLILVGGMVLYLTSSYILSSSNGRAQ
jgi:hypothetical protein